MAKNVNNSILPLPERSRGALVKAESEHTGFALLEFQSPTAALIGEPPPLTARINTYILTAALMCFIAVAFLVKVDMVVTTSAVVVSSVPNEIIQPFETAVVRQVLVHEGDQVKKGQLLAELDPTYSNSDEKSTVAQAASLRAQVDRLRAELASKPYLSDGTPYAEAQAQMFQSRQLQFTSQSDSLKQKVESARFHVEQLKADEKGYAERLPLAVTVESKRRELEKLQVGSQLNTLAAQDARLQLEASLADTRQQLQGAERELAGAIADLQAFVHQWYSDTSDQLATQERLLSDMTGQSTKNALRAQLVELRAPQDSIVLSVSHVSVGAVMQSGDELMRLVPSDAPLVVEGLVAGSDAGFMKVGDYVTLKFDTLPYIIYGFATGKLENISSDSFANVPPPQSNPLPAIPSLNGSQTNNMPGVSPVAYKVRISIRNLSLHGVPDSFKVVPGMPITADIKVGKRTVFNYLFERIIPTFTEGMREPS